MAYSHFTDAIEHGSGKFSKNQYYISNSTPEDFTANWAVREPDAPFSGSYTIKAGDIGGPYPEFLAYHITRHLVDREIIRDGKENSIANPNVRQVYEAKYMKPIVEGEEDPRISAIREEERKKVEAEFEHQPVSEASITSSETRREVVEAKAKTPKAKKEFAGANRG